MPQRRPPGRGTPELLLASPEACEFVGSSRPPGRLAWTVGTVDAAGRGEGCATGWQVDLPPQVVPGPAVLSAAGVEVPVEIRG